FSRTFDTAGEMVGRVCYHGPYRSFVHLCYSPERSSPMSLRGQPIPPIPEETARVARAAFPHGNTYLALRDELGTVFADEDFASLSPTRGQPAFAPWRLALVTVWQFAENLSDRQAAEAVRARIDWKYALGLELTDSGFDHSI